MSSKLGGNSFTQPHFVYPGAKISIFPDIIETYTAKASEVEIDAKEIKWWDSLRCIQHDEGGDVISGIMQYKADPLTGRRLSPNYAVYSSPVEAEIVVYINNDTRLFNKNLPITVYDSQSQISAQYLVKTVPNNGLRYKIIRWFYDMDDKSKIPIFTLIEVLFICVFMGMFFIAPGWGLLFLDISQNRNSHK